jgi:hypothetical protein
MVQSLRTRLIKFSLLALIFAFFAIPLTMVCLFECRYIVPKRVASVLLFFFR